MNLLDALKKITDPRDVCGRRHKLSSVLCLVIIGQLCGQNSLRGLSRWGRSLAPGAIEKMEFTHGIPCQATLGNILQLVDVEELKKSLIEWQGCLGVSGEYYALDGKVVCGTKTNGQEQLHVLSLFCQRRRQCQGQTALQPGENEISAAFRFLEGVEIEDKTITGDAMFAQKNCAR